MKIVVAGLMTALFVTTAYAQTPNTSTTISQVQAQIGPESEGCIAAFLKHEMGSDEAALMQEAWALDHSVDRSTASFYDQHGRAKIDRAVAKFIGLRVQLHEKCRDLPELMLE